MLNPKFGRVVFALGAGVVLLGGAVRALADDFVTRVNRAYEPISTSRRSDLVLLPLAAKMDPVPREIPDLIQAALLPASSSEFAPAKAWAAKPAQQAVLKALADLSKENDWRQAKAFAQGYGVEAATPELVRAGLYTELGDPPTLAGAQFKYLGALDTIGILVNVEATARAADGRPNDAIDVLTDWAFFSRSMADRQFFKEAAWGLRSLAYAYHRIRDIAYTDMRGSRSLDTTRLLQQVTRLSADKYLDVNRMTFPIADRAGAEQMVARVFEPRGRVKEDVFGPSMARLGSTDHPLRLFSESAKWRQEAQGQYDWEYTNKTVAGVYDDWQNRWVFDWFDSRQLLPTVWSKSQDSMGGLAVLKATTPDLSELAHLRQVARVESVGTRHALALVGTTYLNKSFPPQLSAIRPRWVAELDDDPYNPNTRDRKGKPPLEYFVPRRDTPKDDRGDPTPYEMSIVTDDPAHPLVLRLIDDTFVLYSFGSDNAKNFARRTQNTSTVVQGADFLLFPPVVSLHRQHLIDLGKLK